MRRSILALGIALAVVALMAVPAAAVVNGKIAYVLHDDTDGTHGIYVMNPDGSDQTSITLGHDHAPAWSPDGKKIAFVRIGEVTGHEEIYVVNAGGGCLQDLTNNPSRYGGLTWSPDGTKIAYIQYASGTPPRDYLYVMNAEDGSGKTLIYAASVDFELESPTWNPDGTKIAFEQLFGGEARIYVINIDTLDKTLLASGSGEMYSEPAWSPDGNLIAYNYREFVAGKYYQIFVMNAEDGSGKTALTDNPWDERQPAWSPDGTKIIFTSYRGDNENIYVMNADDGSGQTALTSNPERETSPAWGPDQPPVAWVGPDQTVHVGTLVTLDGSGSYDPDYNLPLKYTWSMTGRPAGSSAALSSTVVAQPTFTPDKAGKFFCSLRVTDSLGAESYPVGVIITATNDVPVVTGVTMPLSPVAVGGRISPTATFTDTDTGDTHTAIWTWGDGNIQTVPLMPGPRMVTTPHSYAQAGIFTVILTVQDDRGGVSDPFPASPYLVVYDPKGGYVAGTGTITSPAGAFAGDPTLTGPASFGFTSKYTSGKATVPSGTTQFQFKLANLDFRSTKYDWMVIAGPKVMYKGTGTINKKGTYAFLLSAIDGQVNGGGGTDKFRVKIWEKSTGRLVYDNQLGATDESDPTTAINSGSIVITKP